MEIIEQREGVNLVTVLGGMYRIGKEKKIKQKDIVEETSLSKGAVSQNIKKLENHNLVNEKENSYEVNEERLMELYRTHLEDYCRRREVPDDFKEINEIRSLTKQKLDGILEGRTRKVILGVLSSVLRSSKDDNNVNTFNEVFHRSDAVLSSLSHAAEDKKVKEDLQLLAVTMDRSSDISKGLDSEIDFSKIPAIQTSKQLYEEINNA